MITLSRLFAIVVASAGLLSHSHAADIQPAIAEFDALHHVKAKQMFQSLKDEERYKDLVNYYLGRIELGSGRFTEARDYLETSIGIEPNTADEYYWLATTCSALMQRPSEAANMGNFVCYIQNLEAALGVNPAHLPSLINLYQFNATGPAAAGASPELAAEMLAKVEKISKADGDASRLQSLNAKKETEAALALARSIVTSYPDSERALLEAGRTFSNNGKSAEALTAFEKAIAKKLTMDNRLSIQAASLEIGHIAWRTKVDVDRGIAVLTRACDTAIFPFNANTNWAYLRLAELYQVKGDAAQRQKYLQLLEASIVEKGIPIQKEIERFAAEVR